MNNATEGAENYRTFAYGTGPLCGRGTGSDWPGGLPGDSRWAGGHPKILYQPEIQSISPSQLSFANC